MIRHIEIKDLLVLKNSESTLKHKTTIHLIKQRIEELSFNFAYYVAVYEDKIDNTVKDVIY